MYNYDHSLSESTGIKFILHDKLLGHGSFGDVFLATDENGRQLAVKCCPSENIGIPNILEASIMASIIHPFLNNALRIFATDSKLYIIQKLAKTDLSQYTRRDKNNYKPTSQELQTWCFQLSHAVLALHNANIIHADIKASNVLLYDDNTVKLTDYTLATKKWSNTDCFNHNVCTCTHRPLECFMKTTWDESLDIWSLGCTFYEIAYGEFLFPYQGSLEEDNNNDNKELKKEAKIRIQRRTVNCLIDWDNRGPNHNNCNYEQFPIDYIPFTFCKEYHKPEMATFNNLICSMLNVDPKLRPSIKEVLNHPFFNGMKNPTYLTVERPMRTLPLAEHARVTRYIQLHSDNQIVQNLALNIYRRCNDLPNINELLKSVTCVWIASKIVIGFPPKINNNHVQPHQILAAERDICHNLLFRLHSD